MIEKKLIKRILDAKAPVFLIAQITLICLYSGKLIFLAFASNTMWGDEAYSLIQIQQSWKDLIQILITIDVHPPFYFFILKAVSLVFTNGIAVMKMVSVFPAILTAIFACLFLKKEFSAKAALVFLLALIACESITRYAIEIRMYSWAMFFITMMAVSAFYFFKTAKRRWWTALLLCAVCAAYTHSFAMLTAAIGYLLLFLYTLKLRKEKILPMLILAGCAIMLFLPWIIVLAGQFSSTVSDVFWIPPLTLKTVLRYVAFVFSAGNKFLSIIFFSIFCAVIVFFFVRKNKLQKDYFVFGGLSCAVLLFLSGIVLSIAVYPLFVARYGVPVLGLVWLFFAAQCAAIQSKRIFIVLLLILSFIGFGSFSHSAKNEIKEHKESNLFYTHITTYLQKDDVFVGGRPYVFIMNYLFPSQEYMMEPVSTLRSYTGYAVKLWKSPHFRTHKLPAEYDVNIYNDRTVWTFVAGRRNDGKMQYDYYTIPPDSLGKFQGDFRWNRYYFRLYRSEPNVNENAN